MPHVTPEQFAAPTIRVQLLDRGARASVYCPAMRYEGTVAIDQLPQQLDKLIRDWHDLYESEVDLDFDATLPDDQRIGRTFTHAEAQRIMQAATLRGIPCSYTRGRLCTTTVWMRAADWREMDPRS